MSTLGNPNFGKLPFRVCRRLGEAVDLPRSYHGLDAGTLCLASAEESVFWKVLWYNVWGLERVVGTRNGLRVYFYWGYAGLGVRL